MDDESPQQKPAPKKSKKAQQRSDRKWWAIALAGITVAIAALANMGHIANAVIGLTEFAKIVFIGHPPPSPPPDTNKQVLEVAAEIRKHFEVEVEHTRQANRPDFTHTRMALEHLKGIDVRNGHYWYFKGEVSRFLMFYPQRFENGCVKDFGVEGPDAIGSYQDDFLKYIELEHVLPPEQTKGGMDREVCRIRPNGFCVQRTAWINHLLANDYYREALRQNDAIMRKFRLQHALESINEAHQYIRPTRGTGFPQRIDSAALKQLIEQELRALP